MCTITVSVWQGEVTLYVPLPAFAQAVEDKRKDDDVTMGEVLAVQQDLSSMSESEKLIVSVSGAGNFNVLNCVTSSSKSVDIFI